MGDLLDLALCYKVDNIRMSSVELNNDLADFTAGWRRALEDNEWITVTYAVIGLTNFGEKPAPSIRLADVLSRSVSEGEYLAQRWGLAGDAGPGRAHLSEPRARTIGFPMSSPGG